LVNKKILLYKILGKQKNTEMS